jgi:pimeloyl-ACP methyl ester carboxylesterase
MKKNILIFAIINILVVCSLVGDENIVSDDLLVRAFAMRSGAFHSDLVVCGAGQPAPFLIHYEVAKLARQEHKDLDESVLFYTPFLKQTKWVRDFLLSPNHFNGHHQKTYTNDGATIDYTYFDRDSDTLLVVGGGFMNQERVASFVKMFNQYDVVLFNHRGIDYDSWNVRPGSWFFEGLHGSNVTLGEKEEQDVIAVIYDILKHKSYAKIYGLGLCYSAPVFIKTAVARPKLFNKLVLDGSWIHIDKVFEAYSKIFWGENEDGLLRKIMPTDHEWYLNTFTWMSEFLSGVKLRSKPFDFSQYLKRLTSPVLFFHSSDDLLVTDNEFHDVYRLIPSNEKVAILTTNNHMSNHLKQNKIYKSVVKSFYEAQFDEFLTGLS